MEFCITQKSCFAFVSTKEIFLLLKWQEVAVIMLSSQLNKYNVNKKAIFLKWLKIRSDNQNLVIQSEY